MTLLRKSKGKSLQRKGTPKKARKRALLGPRWFRRNQRKWFGMNGGDDRDSNPRPLP
jgi:hypothetical protein